ncbi:hypothetical protein H9X86_10245 [Pseudoflavonifractor capillosus]|uniref:hypothetical protein n=1 Tax=Pseudoflavonifractor capillosus TaxID=106588 RepID=UPI00195D119B|nr:hypothetical protein [Pseudoflavonifractor capillosus]MBM6897733.1 hypothetical protein [Pseudoflavonifractor capillosus]
MAFEAIQKVTQTEQTSRSQKAEAAAQAKKIVADAHRAGKELVAGARAQAQEKVKAMMAQAEELAAQQSRQVLEGNAVACEALKKEARGRLDRAADLIVGRVGNH